MTAAHSTGSLTEAWQGATARSTTVLAPPASALPVAPASDREVWGPHSGSADQVTVRDVLDRAQHDLGAPWPQPMAHSYARYFRDGDRDEYEELVFAREQRLSRAVVAAAVTLDPAWIAEVADGVTLLCEQSSWSWPAHDDTHTVHGSVLPTVTDPYVDLGAGEVVGQLAWTDHVLGDQLDEYFPGLRARIRHEARTRVIDPFVRRRDWFWLGVDGDVNNWNPWIHGNILVAALRLMDDGDHRTAVVELVIEGLDRYVRSLPEDGAIDEGYVYWWQGACRALEALQLLAHATRGALVAAPMPCLRATVAFPHRMHLGGPWYLNLADGPARPPVDQPWHALHRAALAVGDEDARRHAAAHRTPGAPVANERSGLGRLLRAMTDREWSDARPANPPLPRDVWLPSTQVTVARGTAGSSAGLTMAIKGGHNDESHNHNDVGSVVVALNGVPVLVDAGRPTYTAQTFGPDRYRIWTMQSSWHNVPEVRGTPQAPGRRFGARDLAREADDRQATVRMDLAPAYPRDDVSRWWRSASLDRSSMVVRITDNWVLDAANDPAPVQVHYLLAGKVQVGAGRAIVTALDGAGTLVLTWEPSGARTALVARPLDDPQLSAVWGAQLTRLTIEVDGSVLEGTIIMTVEEQR